MDVTYFVYVLAFANDKVYIGMSKTDSRGGYTNRFKQHTYAARTDNPLPIYNAWRKHGAPELLIWSTHSTREECALAEIDAIQAHDSMNPERGYNLMHGGQGLHAPPGSAVYELMRAKVWDNPERRRKSSEALKGKPLPEDTQAAQRAWINGEAGKASTRAMTQRADVRAKMSEAMSRRLGNGYREYLSDVQIGKPKNTSMEGRARQAEGRRRWQESEAGKAQSRAVIAAVRANPEHEAKRRAAHAEFASSDANKAHCLEMSAKARRPVRDLATGRVYESRSAAAREHAVSGPTIGYWIKKGKFEYV